MSTNHKCTCTNCGNNCAGKKKAHDEIPTGFFAKRPWIWILLGYFAMVGALSAMVVIAVKHQQPDVPMTHGH